MKQVSGSSKEIVMAWLLYIAPFAGIVIIGFLFVHEIVPALQRALGQ